jgi:succinate dehydrogenase / fumarate reductase, cytochrome b subunit
MADAQASGAATPPGLLTSAWRFASSSVGSKVLMAATGVALWVFIVAHLAANLLVFASPTALNEYGVALRGTGGFLWLARGGLLAVFGLHVFAAIRTVQANRAARPEAYRAGNRAQANWASKWMMLSGLVLLSFLLFHLAHLTFGWVFPEHFAQTDAEGRHDVFAMVVLGFRNPLVALFYVVGMVLLALHLSHGIYSMFQHVGMWGSRFSPTIMRTGQVIAWAISLGFIAIPLAVLFGLIGEGI